MANHKSALKRIRSNETKRLRNKHQHKTTRNAIKKLRELTEKKAAEKLFPSVESMIDKLAKKNIIHDNKAANLKSGLTKHIASLQFKDVIFKIQRPLILRDFFICIVQNYSKKIILNRFSIKDYLNIN